MTRLCVTAALLLTACSANNSDATTTERPPTAGAMGSEDTTQAADSDASASDAQSSVIAVTVTGAPGAYTFATTLASPDTGCEQYADWWEVLDADGALLYRRILTHSHVDEQPFTRTGGPVPIDPEQVVFVRAHLSNGGFGDQVLTGTAAGGFSEARALPEIAASIEAAEPQPTGCAF